MAWPVVRCGVDWCRRPETFRSASEKRLNFWVLARNFTRALVQDQGPVREIIVVVIIASPERSTAATKREEDRTQSSKQPAMHCSREENRHHCSTTELFPCKWAGDHDSFQRAGGVHMLPLLRTSLRADDADAAAAAAEPPGRRVERGRSTGELIMPPSLVSHRSDARARFTPGGQATTITAADLTPCSA